MTSDIRKLLEALGRMAPPPPTPEQIVREREESAAQERREAVEALDRRAGIPPRYRDADPHDWLHVDAGKRAAFDALRRRMGDPREVLATPRSAVVVGRPGVGKTRATIAIGRLWSEAGVSWLYVPFDDLYREVRAAPDGGRRSDVEILDDLARRKLLILDDIGGAGEPTELGRTLISMIIDRRYREMLPTIVVTNYGKDELAERVGERVIDRLRQGGGNPAEVSIVFPGASLRGQHVSTRPNIDDVKDHL